MFQDIWDMQSSGDLSWMITAEEQNSQRGSGFFFSPQTDTNALTFLHVSVIVVKTQLALKNQKCFSYGFTSYLIADQTGKTSKLDSFYLAIHMILSAVMCKICNSFSCEAFAKPNITYWIQNYSAVKGQRFLAVVVWKHWKTLKHINSVINKM